jgi:hypothetical protein
MWIVLLCMHPSAQILNMQISVATAIAGVFAIFANKIDKITDKLEDVDKVKSQGVSCQH